MTKLRFTYYQDDEWWIGWLLDFPDYRTQGTSFDELQENLRDLYDDLTSGVIPYIRHVGELTVA